MQNNLKQLESEALARATLDDGLLDILCGICLISWGIMMACDVGGLGGITFAVCFPALMALRKKLVEPRIGSVRLKRSTLKLKQLMLMGLFSFTFVLGLAFFVMSNSGAPKAPAEWLESFGNPARLMFAFILALVSTVLGFVFGARRAHGYALGILAVFSATPFLAPQHPWAEMTAPLVISGLLPLGFGCWLLLRFLRHHPRCTPPADLFE
ncbi:MAG: hypothetical protein QF724_13195 [Planctomycetota bacterium]|nr:hypothetical protein [Planctomycetota bacterium]